MLTGQEGFEPPASGFGDRRSTSWSYWPVLDLKTLSAGPAPERHPEIIPEKGLLRLAVNRVMSAPWAEFLHLQTFSRLLPVLCRRVVSLFAVRALHCDDVPHMPLTL